MYANRQRIMYCNNVISQYYPLPTTTDNRRIWTITRAGHIIILFAHATNIEF